MSSQDQRGRTIQELASFTVFNLVLAFFPLTTLLSSNPHLLRQAVTPEQRFLVTFFFVVFALNELVFLVFRKWRGHGLFYLFLVLLFLWNPFLDAIGHRGLVGAVFFALMFAGVFSVALWVTRFEQPVRVLTVALFVFAAVPAVRIPFLAATAGPEPPARRADAGQTALTRDSGSAQPARLPTLYLLVFDTMTSTGELLEHVDSSESARRQVREFEESMRALGYYHFTEAWSNYERTAPSMSSFFNFDYHDADFEWYQKYYGFTHSAMVDDFKAAGYRIVASKKDVPCPEELDECYPAANQYELVSMLAATTPTLYTIQRLDRYLFRPLKSNALRGIAGRLTSMKLEEVDRFIEYMDSKPATRRPTLLYAHFFATHPGNFYDENCETESMRLFEQRSGEQISDPFSFPHYAAEYLCFLKRITSVARAIERNDPDAWVFITSDHGYGFQSHGPQTDGPWDKARLDATFRVLNLAKTSPSCREELRVLKSSVNKARGLVNCLHGAVVLPYLPEQVDLRYVGPEVRLTIGAHGYGSDSAPPGP